MAESRATVRWSRGGQPFTDGRYRRAHAWSFDGGVEVPASSSPAVVPVPLSEDRASGILHREAHERCFIANSVRTEVRCEPSDG